jgi:radical SAM protein with 4Fe4S-binding SPASM domain
MRYHLSPYACLKWLETRSVYHLKTDELYELDEQSFYFLELCSSGEGCSDDDAAFIDYCKEEGILVPFPAAVQRPPLNKSPEPSLRYLELQITDRCNLRCRHCYIGYTAPHELTVDQIRNVLREFEEMQGLRVLITGGEPLLHGDFPAINRMLPEFMLRKVLFSNGLQITATLLDELQVEEIQISIDGLEPAHDSLRGKGSFRKAMDALALCIKRGFAVSVATMIHAGNLADFEIMDTMFREMGVRDWTVDVPCVSGRLEDNQEFRISPAEGGRYLAYGFGAGIHGSGDGFGCGLHLMSVLADGRIAKCTFYADNYVGTINDGLRECWKRIVPVRLADLACDCAYLETCRGGCRYRAKLLGSATGKDLYRCSLYDIIKSETDRT